MTIGDRVMLRLEHHPSRTPDFHPVEPSARRLDAEAVSPLGDQRERPSTAPRPVTIGSDTWVGPNAVILKGVEIGEGCFIEPGSVGDRRPFRLADGSWATPPWWFETL